MKDDDGMTAPVGEWLDNETVTGLASVPPGFLTVILALDCEKGVAMTRRFMANMRHFNAHATGRLQVIVIDQTMTGEHEDACRAAGFPVEYHRSQHPFVGGYPIWDLLKDTRAIWPTVRGEYVTFCHPEFFYMPGDWSRTALWLHQVRPIVALGNLRRLVNGRMANEDGVRGARLNGWLDSGEHNAFWSDIARHGHGHWVYWQGPPKDNGAWLEDIFYIRKDYMDASRFLCHGGEQALQDIYDLVRVMQGQLAKHGANPWIHRLGRDINTVLHLWHTRQWGFGRPEIRDWFLKNPEKWRDTTFLREDIWNGLIEMNEGRVNDDKHLDHLRRAPGGTVTRWTADFSEYLQEGGSAVMRAYNEEHSPAHVAE